MGSATEAVALNDPLPPPMAEGAYAATWVLIGLHIVAELIMASVLWSRHRQFIMQRRPRSLLMLAGLVFTFADCVFNIAMLITSSTGYIAVWYYLARCISFYPISTILYLATVYRLIILVMKPYIRTRLLVCSYVISAIILSLELAGFALHFVAANNDPVLIATPVPAWSALPGAFYLIASVVMSVYILVLVYRSVKPLTTPPTANPRSPPATLSDKPGGAPAQQPAHSHSGGADSSGPSSGSNSASADQSIYFPLSMAFKLLTALQITLWLLFFVIFFATAHMDRRMNAAALSCVAGWGMLTEAAFEYLLRATRRRQVALRNLNSGSAPKHPTTAGPSVQPKDTKHTPLQQSADVGIDSYYNDSQYALNPKSGSQYSIPTGSHRNIALTNSTSRFNLASPASQHELREGAGSASTRLASSNSNRPPVPSHF
ncbi:hypothetical protein RI367_007692 [Sorochytrium milnesiophthora]